MIPPRYIRSNPQWRLPYYRERQQREPFQPQPAGRMHHASPVDEGKQAGHHAGNSEDHHMTELDLTPEGWTEEHQQHLEEMQSARMAEDKHIRWLVSKELEKYLPEYIEAEEQAAELVRVSYEALQSPESDLAAIDKQVGEVEGACISWEAKLTDSAAEMRVEAHRRFTDWNHELRLLNQDRDKLLLDEVEPLRAAYAEARAKLAHATSEREAIELNISDCPYWGNGHLTDAYQVWRADAGHLVPVLLRGEEGVPEWDAAFAWMDRLCARSGYRTEGRIPTRAEETKRAIENYLAADSSVQPAPNAMDLRLFA
jgi:hypothetical protein